MALIEHIPASEVATATARALEGVLGHDVMLTVGEPIADTPTPQLLPEGETRCVALPFGNGAPGEVTLVMTNRFAQTIEAARQNGELVSGALIALEAAAGVVGPIIGQSTTADYAGEISTETLLTSVDGEFVIVPIFESDETVACVIVRLAPDAFAEAAPAPVIDAEPIDAAPVAAPRPVATPPVAVPAPAPAAPAPAPISAAPAAEPAVAAAVEPEIARYEFQPLGDGVDGVGSPRPLHLLNDVEMDVVAELGRQQMKVRDLVSLRVGSVIELDRTAGSPVDVMVNGSLLAHGEVVVIDDEFGIRVSEIVTGDN
jgi:flagellar motor switch protein FliN/FliY